MGNLTVAPQVILVHCQRSPYSDSLARTGIELAMATAAFDQPIALLFSGDGVWQLLDDQAPPEGTKHHGKLVSALPVFGVDALYVDEQSLLNRGLKLDDLCIQARAIDAAGIRTLLCASLCVYNF